MNVNAIKRFLGIPVNVPTVRYTEQHISLFERQVAARNALHSKEVSLSPASVEFTLHEIEIDYERERTRLAAIEGTLNQLEW